VDYMCVKLTPDENAMIMSSHLGMCCKEPSFTRYYWDVCAQTPIKISRCFRPNAFDTEHCLVYVVRTTIVDTRIILQDFISDLY